MKAIDREAATNQPPAPVDGPPGHLMFTQGEEKVLITPICLLSILSKIPIALQKGPQLKPLQREELQAALRDLSAKFGTDCFYRVELADPAARLPEQRYHFKQVVDE